MVAAERLVELEQVEVAARQAAQHAGVGEHGEVAVHRALRQAVAGAGEHLGRRHRPAGTGDGLDDRPPLRRVALPGILQPRADRGVAIAGPGRRRRHAGAPYRWPDDRAERRSVRRRSAGSGRSRRTEADQWARCSGPNEPGSSSSTVNVRRTPSGPAAWTGVPGPGELPDPLAAAAAARRQALAVGDGEHLDDLALAGRDHRPDRRGLGADALGERGVLDVGTDVHGPRRGPHRGTDAEPGVRRVGVRLDGAGGGEQLGDVVGGHADPGYERRLTRMGQRRCR